MIAYYIYWTYPPSADDANYYAGNDDNRWFHHKENAEAIAEHELENCTGSFFEDCWDGDIPDGYRICERDITFEDEE